MTTECTWEAMSAVTAVLALIFAIPMLIEARRARRVTLSITLSERFSSDDMHQALAYLGRRRDEYKSDIKAMCDACVAEVKVEVEEAKESHKLSEWDCNRRKISKFFISARHVYRKAA